MNSPFQGRFLRLDMNNGRTADVIFDAQTMRSYVGGTAIGIKILYSEVHPSVDWRDPENRLIFASGPLCGTAIGGSGAFSLVTRGALTNGATAVQANGLFGAFLRFCGYDGIIVQGVAERWTYLHISDERVELKEASHLQGKDTYETVDLLNKDLGKGKGRLSIVSIGPAGEHMVRFAGVFAEKGHSASHNGSGAVMGSKRLKAIVVSKGGRKVEVKDKGRLLRVANELHQNAKGFRGTIELIGPFYEAGNLPIKNYLTNVWNIRKEEFERFGDSYVRKTYKPKPNPCWACRLAHTHATMMNLTDNQYEGIEVEEPEYEQLAAWGALIGNNDVSSAMMLSGLTDRLGLENNEAGWLVAWIMECYEKGLFTRNSLDNLEMSWGNTENVARLLNMIANRQGIGDLLAEGVMRASQEIGGEASESAVYTLKGNTPRSHDHRTRWLEMFDTCVSNTGTIEVGPMRSRDGRMSLQGPSNPLEVSTVTAEKSGMMVFEDSLVVCRFNGLTNLELESEALRSVTGWDFTSEEARKLGLRAVNLMKAFNIRCGLTRELDHPSKRYGSTPVDGPFRGKSMASHWERMLDNYYRLMGWDVKTGIPLPETLQKLGLNFVIKDLW